RNRPIWSPTFSAESGGARDELVESFGWSIPSEGLAGAPVEQGGEVIEFGLAVNGQVGAFGQELADHAVPVLVAAALPWRVGVSEVDLHAGGDAERGVAGEFFALIPGQWPHELGGESADVGDQSFDDVVGGAVVEADQHPHPGGTLDEGGDLAGPAGADDQRAFLVSGDRPVVGLGRTLRDVDHPRDLADTAVGAGPAVRPASFTLAAQRGDQ